VTHITWVVRSVVNYKIENLLKEAVFFYFEAHLSVETERNYKSSVRKDGLPPEV
jgi:hypothetical protein